MKNQENMLIQIALVVSLNSYFILIKAKLELIEYMPQVWFM